MGERNSVLTAFRNQALLVCEQATAPGFREQVARHSAKDPFLHAAVAVSSDHDQVRGTLQEKRLKSLKRLFRSD